MSGKLFPTLVLFAILAVAWLTVVPTHFGGRATYVRVSGTSMLPNIEPGDVVLLYPKDEYEIGDVIAFRSKELGDAVIIHRVISRDLSGTRYLTHGDNTNFVDISNPLPEEILGAQYAQFPNGSVAMDFVKSPLGFGGLSALAGATILLGNGNARMRRRRA